MDPIKQVMFSEFRKHDNNELSSEQLIAIAHHHGVCDRDLHYMHCEYAEHLNDSQVIQRWLRRR